MPVIRKLYTTDLPFYIIGKRRDVISIKPGLLPTGQQRYDEATIRPYMFENIVVVRKPQVTKKDILDWRKFLSFIRSELVQ